MLKISDASRYASPKIISLSKAALIISKNKKSGKTVGLCHGGFDLLHPGHLTHFQSAKKTCDVLVVSVTSDRFVTARKGNGRPVFPEKLRAYAVAALSWVDYVVITDFKKGVEVINTIKPSFYIKGPDMIGKMTPGIMAEREAIEKAGGKVIYTKDPKLSTTEIIRYIQDRIPRNAMLIISDRDGTLIEDVGYIGRHPQWQKEIKLKQDVVAFLSYLTTKYEATIIGLSNQSGVARGYFPESTIRNINAFVDKLLRQYKVTISQWEYCMDVDSRYVKTHPGNTWIKQYIKQVTKRKPQAAMVDDALIKLGKKIADYSLILVIGDHIDDRGLAKTLAVPYIDVKGKTYDDLVTEFAFLKLTK